jgi:cellulose synthase/poly-beta-1,6-N-acetylglucosamine synthase-like glycosyltransferase/peptidoglycan/xylan/chitin deacetylase (PgdA/CDA1 family)
VTEARTGPSIPADAAPDVASRRRLLRPRWFGVIGAMVVFCSMLGIDGIVTAQIGLDAKARPPAGFGEVPKSIHQGGPVIDATQDRVASHSMPARTIALTFDDGPDPRWTPEVLRVLRKHDVPGTFFVVGSATTRYPDLVEAMYESGGELGVHTFTHPDLGTVSTVRAAHELSQTQLALAGAAGVTTYLVRPPYSSHANAVDDVAWQSITHASEQGYVTVLSDTDSRDWRRTGVADIIRDATPPDDGRGAIILLHDGFGDRSQTAAALDQLIPQLKAKGYRFTTVSEGLGFPPANQPADPLQRLRGEVLIGAVTVSTTVVAALETALVVTGLLVVARLLLMVVLSARHTRQRRSRTWTWGPEVTAPVSIVVPAYNEKECIADTVRSLVATDYPVEVIVIDDGSLDDTAAIVAALGLPNVQVARQANAGKAAALNHGISLARHDLIVMIDGDTVFEPETVRRLVQPFANPTVGAVAGNTKVANRRSMIAAWQHIEYVIGFNIDRRVYDVLRCMPTVPGAIGAFRRAALEQVGGVSSDTLAEDTDLTMALCRAGWRVVYQEDARAWTEAPTRLQQLWRQRYRWSYGTMQSMWKHRRALLETGSSGRFGRVGLINLALFQVLLPLLAPLIDVLLIYGLLFLDPVRTLFAWFAILAIQMLGAVYAFRLDRERLGVLWLMPAQQFVYRQITYAVLLQSAATAVAGVRLRWHKLHRAGGLEKLMATQPPVR